MRWFRISFILIIICISYKLNRYQKLIVSSFQSTIFYFLYFKKRDQFIEILTSYFEEKCVNTYYEIVKD